MVLSISPLHFQLYLKDHSGNNMYCGIVRKYDVEAVHTKTSRELELCNIKAAVTPLVPGMSHPHQQGLMQTPTHVYRK